MSLKECLRARRRWSLYCVRLHRCHLFYAKRYVSNNAANTPRFWNVLCWFFITKINMALQDLAFKILLRDYSIWLGQIHTHRCGTPEPESKSSRRGAINGSVKLCCWAGSYVWSIVWFGSRQRMNLAEQINNSIWWPDQTRPDHFSCECNLCLIFIHGRISF